MNDEVSLSLFKTLVRGEDDFHFSPDSIMSVAGTCRWVGQRLSGNGQPAPIARRSARAVTHRGWPTHHAGGLNAQNVVWWWYHIFTWCLQYEIMAVYIGAAVQCSLFIIFFILFSTLRTTLSTLLYKANKDFHIQTVILLLWLDAYSEPKILKMKMKIIVNVSFIKCLRALQLTLRCTWKSYTFFLFNLSWLENVMVYLMYKIFI